MIEVEIKARHQFRDFLTTDKRWSIAVAHRRAGKTVACIQNLAKKALECTRREGRFAYVAPLYNQAKDVAWFYLKHYAIPLEAAINESELRIDLPRNGARIRLYGADNPDRLRGLYLDGVVLDEYADMRPSVWGEIIRPMLADRQGWATFIGTPKGRNEFFDIWSRAQLDPTWFHLMLRASQTGLLPQSELDAAAADMTPEQYAQEFECSFDAAIVGAYWGKEIAQAERDGRIKDVPCDPLLPVHTAWDLGIGDSTAIWFFQVSGSEVRVIDYYENFGQSLAHYAAVLSNRGYRYEHDFVPHDAKVRELGTGRTRIETLLSLKRKPKLVPDHTVMDRINAGRLTIPRCWFDKTRCADGIEALRQYQAEYDEKLRTFKDHPRHDWASHPADAFGYMAVAYRELAALPAPVKGRTVETPRGPVFIPDVIKKEPTLDELWELRAQQTGEGGRI